MHHPSPTLKLLQDWSACKQAYDDAVFFTGVSKGWAEGTTQHWRDHFAELAGAFKFDHGIDFDPKKPILLGENA